MDAVETIESWGLKVVGYVALQEINPEGETKYFPGDVIPDAETWPSLHNLIRQGMVAPAIAMPPEREDTHGDKGRAKKENRLAEARSSQG